MASAASVPQYLLATVPVVQPPHLEGDPALATEILPGPPSLASIRQNHKKIDPKKPAVPLSYLPQSDPGTTYAGLAGIVALQDSGSRRKRARIDRGPSNRAQRASARNLAQSTSAGALSLPQDIDSLSTQTIQDIEPPLLGDDDAPSSNSRSASVQPIDIPILSNPSEMNGERSNGKGKGKRRADKELEKVNVRVKEEPVTVHLSDIPTGPANEDHCSACSSVGALVYCDGCPRAYHLWCLNPPMDPSELPPSEENWYCPACKLAQGPPLKLPHTLVSPLLQTLHSTLPVEFQLPDDIRGFFRDVGTGYGGVYVDTSTVKPPRIGRHGIGEERDPYRLKDHKGTPILCYKCGKSALPDVTTSEGPSKRPRRSSRASSQTDQWKSLMSCDYCSLHWHIDCLEPPLATLPPATKKWKCPNHASNCAPKRRIPKSAGPPVDITTIGQANNGNIEIINIDTPVQQQDRMAVDEVLINGRRYRIPERVVVLDFWNKVQRRQMSHPKETATALLSPLTSLSSLDDSLGEPPSLDLDDEISDNETYRVAQSPEAHLPRRQSHRRRTFEKSVQTIYDEPVRFTREAVGQSSGVSKAFKQLDPNQGHSRRERTSGRITRAPPSHVAKQPVKSLTNGKSSRSMKVTSPYERASHTTRTKKPTSPTINRAANGSDGLNGTLSGLFRTKSNDSEPKSGGSPFKIRIPGRTQLKSQSTTVAPISVSAPVAPEHDQSTPLSSSSQSRPRRSSRRQESVTSSGDQSLSSLSTFTKDTV